VGAELERLAAEGTLRKLNAGLEARIAERTAELTKANAELEAFTYSVSHDLRAPLRAIHGFSRALEEDCASQLDATAMGHLERIRAGSTRMAQLIDDLLELSRVSRHTLSRTRTDLSAVARRCVDQLAAASPGRLVEVHVLDGLEADCDPRLVDVVLTNLLGNAWKFTSKKPGAHIEVGRDGPSAFFVRDDGAGFDPAYGGKLFKPFQRLHHSSEFPGTGIGLALVHRIIDRHGGTVWAEGREQGGATFHFTLGGAEG
jgi:light-regulated signal transduction histidine kinase (bacteriophytochrome)